MTTTEAMKVHEAVTEVARRVGAIGKDRSAGERAGGYRYRGIEAVMNHLGPVLHQVGVVLVPHVVESSIEPYGDRGWRFTRLVVEYDVIGPTGDMLPRPVRVVADGVDAMDKGPGKALSYAYKTAVGQLFAIPTDAALDIEATDEATAAPPTLSAEQADQIRAVFADKPPTAIVAWLKVAKVDAVTDILKARFGQALEHAQTFAASIPSSTTVEADDSGDGGAP